MENGMVVIAIAFSVLLLIALATAIRRMGRSSSLPIERKQLLTDHEKAFFAKLCRTVEAAGAYRVHPQVAMGALIRTRSGLDQSEARGVRNRFDRKIVDFVIVDRNMEVVLIVELDDRTHSSDRDAARDAMTREAGYRTVRLRNGYRISGDQIADAILPLLAAGR